MHSRQVNIMSTHSVDKLAVKKLITSKYSKTADDFWKTVLTKKQWY